MPTPRDGEMLYSVLARYGRYLNAMEAGPLMAELLGQRHAIASTDLPGNLSALVRNMELDGRNAAVDRIVDDLTAFPFHTAFVPREVREGVRWAMRADMTGIYTRLGLAAFKVRPPERLRFCPTCQDEMERDWTDLWWRREHQLPGVPVCSIHSCVLRVSSVDPGDRARHSFVPATREVCLQDAGLAVVADGDDLRRLSDLARAAVALLGSPPPARGYDEINARYRAGLLDVGLMRSARKIDQGALLLAFRSRWGAVPELLPGLELGSDPERSWLTSLVRNSRRAAHPLQHIMLQVMIADMATVEADAPFGSGPWVCRNALADHHGDFVIEAVGVRRDRGATYGDFVCGCGYFYTVGISAEGAVGAPRYRRFGPLLAPAIEAAVKDGNGLRATSAAVGLDPKTLIREAWMSGIAVPWSTAASGRIPGLREVALAKSAFRARRISAGTKRNWFAIDTRLARSARSTALAVAAERPPVRVTVAEIERRIARPDWIVKRSAKLPQTVAAIAAVVEDVNEFRLRRLAWCVSKAVDNGDLRPCEVLRAAGLPMDWLPNVRDALVMIELRGSVAA